MKNDSARRVERRATRMAEMMARQNVDVRKLSRLDAGGAYLQARGRCLKCAATQDCLLWLDAEAQAQVVPDFCPNLALFRSFRARKT